MASPDIDRLDSYLRQVIAAVDAWSAAIMVSSEDGQILVPLVSVDFPAGWSTMYNALDSTTLVGRAYITGETQVYAAGSIAQPSGSTESHFMSAIAAVPVQKADTLIATVEIIKDQVGANFSEEDVILLEKVVKELAEFI